VAQASSSPIPQACQTIINDAYFDAGYIGEGEDANSEQATTGMRKLNKLVNYLGTKGLKLWVQEDYSLQAPILQEGVSLYTFGPSGTVAMVKPRRVIEGYFVEPNSQARRPLIPMARSDWDALATISAQGTVTSYFPDKQQLTLNVNLWMVPNSTEAEGQCHLILDEQIGNFSNLTDTMNFPPEWQLTLEWGLADLISIGQPKAIIELCKFNAKMYREELEDWDVEDPSTTFTPDTRARFVGRRFT
jgi:hypothetical protein